MNQQTSEELRSYFRRVRNIFPELFNMAHAICGNYDLAEYALRSALLSVWSQNTRSGMGFREKLRSTLRRAATRETLSSRANNVDFTWDGFKELGTQDDLILKQAAQESLETRRFLMLRLGCGLSIGQIARVTDAVPAQVRTALSRFESQCRRKLPAQYRKHFDALLVQCIQKELARTDGDIPNPAAMYHTFELEASELEFSEHRASTIVSHIMVFIIAAVCAIFFWLFAVIVATPASQPIALSTTETQETTAFTSDLAASSTTFAAFFDSNV